jgi:hypothetical protein
MAFLLFFTAVILSGIAAYYSVIGLIAIFSAAVIPVAIMGGSLEAAKLVVASWLYRYWKAIPFLMKAYFTSALVILMLITSMGIFGFLSKAHSDQSLVSGDVLAKLSIYDEKIKTAKENIEANRKQLKQMDEAVDQVMGRSTDEKGADKAVAIRKSQQRDRAALAKDIEANQKLIASLNDEAAPIRAEVRKVEAEVGPLKYIAALIYGDNPSENMLERSVRWLIILLICVFDPLAVLMLIAANLTQMKQAEWKSKEEGDSPQGPSENLSTTVTEPMPQEQVETKGEENDIEVKVVADQAELPVDTQAQSGTQSNDTEVVVATDDTPAKVEAVGKHISVYADQQPLANRINEEIPETKPEEVVQTSKKKVKKNIKAEPAVQEPTTQVVEQKEEAKSIEDQVNSLIESGDQNGLEAVYRQIVKELGKKNRNKSTHWGPIKSK